MHHSRSANTRAALIVARVVAPLSTVIAKTTILDIYVRKPMVNSVLVALAPRIVACVVKRENRVLTVNSLINALVRQSLSQQTTYCYALSIASFIVQISFLI
jgi:hypothetical protein